MKKKLLALAAITAPAFAFAGDLDAFTAALGTKTTDMVSDMTAVAVIALPIFAVVYGLRLVIRMFKTVK